MDTTPPLAYLIYLVMGVYFFFYLLYYWKSAVYAASRFTKHDEYDPGYIQTLFVAELPLFPRVWIVVGLLSAVCFILIGIVSSFCTSYLLEPSANDLVYYYYYNSKGIEMVYYASFQFMISALIIAGMSFCYSSYLLMFKFVNGALVLPPPWLSVTVKVLTFLLVIATIQDSIVIYVTNVWNWYFYLAFMVVFYCFMCAMLTIYALSVCFQKLTVMIEYENQQLDVCKEERLKGLLPNEESTIVSREVGTEGRMNLLLQKRFEFTLVCILMAVIFVVYAGFVCSDNISSLHPYVPDLPFYPYPVELIYSGWNILVWAVMSAGCFYIYYFPLES